jgi:phage shock protein PspC (stress-responsive transcriptional regulator)
MTEDLVRTDPLAHNQRRARRPAGAERPLRRQRKGRVIGGVCAGIGRFVGVSANIPRALWLISLIPSLGTTLLAYPLLWLLLPEERA